MNNAKQMAHAFIIQLMYMQVQTHIDMCLSVPSKDQVYAMSQVVITTIEELAEILSAY